MISRGSLLVFEGCDRTGKTTQCRKLVEVLNRLDFKAEFMAFPDRTTAIGGIINSYLQKKTDLTDRAVHLLFSANRWELIPKMKELLSNGTTLVVDRYAYSGVAFSAAKTNMDMEWCKNPDKGLPKPDAVFYLTMSLDGLARRGDFGGERYETNEMQTRVKENFSKLQDRTWKVIDADAHVDWVHEEILSHALEIVNEDKSWSSLGQLW